MEITTEIGYANIIGHSHSLRYFWTLLLGTQFVAHGITMLFLFLLRVLTYFKRKLTYVRAWRAALLPALSCQWDLPHASESVSAAAEQ